MGSCIYLRLCVIHLFITWHWYQWWLSGVTMPAFHLAELRKKALIRVVGPGACGKQRSFRTTILPCLNASFYKEVFRDLTLNQPTEILSGHNRL